MTARLTSSPLQNAMAGDPVIIQLNILEGKAQEFGPYTGVFPKVNIKGDLYLLVETSLQDHPEEGRHAVEIIRENFAASKVSVTTGLAQAIRAAQRKLGPSPPQAGPQGQTSGLGSVCAALRGDEAYLAQKGPTSAYIIRGQEVTFLTHSNHDALSPLTLESGQVRLHRHVLQKGDIILLAPSRLSSLVSKDVLAAYFSQGLEVGMQKLYRAIRRERRFALLAIAFPEMPKKPPQGAPSVTAWLPRGKGKGELPLAKPVPAPRKAVPIEGPRPRGIPSRRGKASTKTPESLDVRPSLRLELKDLPRWASKYNTSYVSNLMTAVFLTVVVIAGLAAVSQLPGYLRQGAENRFVNSLNRADLLVNEALSSKNRDTKRQKLEEAGTLVNTALSMKSADPHGLSLKENIRNHLSEMDAVEELTGIRLLADFRAMKTTPTLLRDILLYDGKLYILDKGSDQVFEYPLVQGDDSSRQSGNLPRALPSPKSPSSNLTHLFFMSKGGLWPRDSLVVLDEARKMWEYSLKDDPRAVSVRGAEEWASLQTSAGYGGYLYVLDPVSSQVWRYAPTDNGYDSERKGILGGADIRDAVDMMLDGDLYILNRSGQIFKLVAASTQVFSQEGIDKPLANPVSIFTSPQAKLVYVVDAGNQRIVVFDKAGKFQRQLVSRYLPPIRDIYVDEGQKTIYLISDNLLYAASLP